MAQMHGPQSTIRAMTGFRLSYFSGGQGRLVNKGIFVDNDPFLLSGLLLGHGRPCFFLQRMYINDVIFI